MWRDFTRIARIYTNLTERSVMAFPIRDEFPWKTQRVGKPLVYREVRSFASIRAN